MLHQIKLQLSSTLEKIDRQTKIENLCSKLSLVLNMASSVDGLTDTETFFDSLYSQVEGYIKSSVELIKTFDNKQIPGYEEKEEPTE